MIHKRKGVLIPWAAALGLVSGALGAFFWERHASRTPTDDEPAVVATPLFKTRRPAEPLFAALPRGAGLEGGVIASLPPDPFGRELAEGMVITGATPHRMILFTFDDGPNLDTTPRLLDLLDAEGIRAVFFFTADRIRGLNERELQQQQVAREVLRRGHMIANHTAHHVSLYSLDTAEIDAELADAEHIMERVLGGRPYLFRPPGGNRSPRTDSVVEARGYTQVLWNLGAGDTQLETPEAVLETWKKVLDRREREHGERGGIVLLHDLHEHAVEALPLIVAEIRRRNCALLRDESEELYDIVDDPFFFYRRKTSGRIGEEAPPATLPPEVFRRRQAALREDAAFQCTSPDISG